MSLHLWILRHGEAEPYCADDAGRALIARGQDNALAAGRWLAAQPQPPCRLLCSPYRRAQETAEAVRQSLPGLRLETVDWLTPDTAPLTVVKHLSAIFDTPLLLVSHQPLVSDLIGVLTEGVASGMPRLSPASLAELDLPLVAAGFGTLQSLRHAPDHAIAALQNPPSRG